MKNIKRALEKLRKVRKKQHHPLLYEIHKKHKISKKTLFYIKEYGTEKKVISTVLKESIKILIFASIISAFGGLGLEEIKARFIAIIPLLVLMPALNDMIGDYGTIISSKFATMLHKGKIKGRLSKIPELRGLFFKIFTIALITTILGFIASILISYYVKSYQVTLLTGIKIFSIVIIDVIFLISLLFISSVLLGLYIYRKKEDPNNFLIPITTSVADFANMLILAGLVILFF